MRIGDTVPCRPELPVQRPRRRISSCRTAIVAVLAVLAACASDPPPPAWRAEAKSWLDTSISAYLRGDTRPADAAFAHARREISGSGSIDLLARAELNRCAARVASAVFEPCAGFEALRSDAGAELQAYADYLEGRVRADAAQLLPPAHRSLGFPRPWVDPGSTQGRGGESAATALRAIEDPLSRLVALGVLFRTGRADAEAIAIGVDAASEHGWRRPLLAWLEIQAATLEQGGRTREAERVRRRIELVGTGTLTPR